MSIHTGDIPLNNEETKEELERIKASFQQLLDLCARNEVEIPEELKEALTGKPSSEGRRRRPSTPGDLLTKSILETPQMKEFAELTDTLNARLPDFDLRVKDGSYTVVNYLDDDPFAKDNPSDHSGRAKQKIKTVQTESPFYKLASCVARCVKGGRQGERRQEKIIMEKVNLVFEPSKMYLVLGAPGSGKSTLLKMIADNLHKSKNHTVGGSVLINGVAPSDVVWTNLVAYIDQIDRLHPFLTVYETCEFAWRCRSGGTHRKPWYGEGPEVDAAIEKLDAEMMMVNKILESMGLARVKDTFVGDQQKVRGVSGGEKKRVTVAEMLCVGSPVVACDEISTGLDAATTYDITKTFGMVCRIKNIAMIVSLLQPPPETVANFDELILLSDGKIIYAGPVSEVMNHFTSLGYQIPERMDVADWLQALPTKDGWQFLIEAKEDGSNREAVIENHLTTDEFVERFNSSELGMEIQEKLNAPIHADSAFIKQIASDRYANTWFQSLQLVVRREMILWWREKDQIVAKVMQSIVMGIVVGTLFWQQTEPGAIIGALFQSAMFCVIGAMLLVVKQFPERSIYYKHQDANFFPTSTYVVGRSVSSIPSAFIDAILYGTLIYWFVGLAYGDGANIGNYFMFCALLFLMSLTSGLMFSVFAASVASITIAQACMAVCTIFFVLFSGFTVQPDVIPVYYIWIYWINFFAWVFRGLAVNEFDSGAYDDLVSGSNTTTRGELILTQFGFTNNDDPFDFIWAVWALLFTLGFAAFSISLSNFLLRHVRFTTGGSLNLSDSGNDEGQGFDESRSVQIPFKKVKLTFRDIHYTVKASTSKEKLELLKGIDGVIEAGKMTALMGSSGAGKTTLMDVLAMRKNSGVIEGEIRLNGHLQEEQSFRRCAGYVEQFDVQLPQLTIRETMRYSAKLRLDESDPMVTHENIETFVDQTLDMLELTNIQDLQVGSDDAGGLSFEQRKRLSIGVELVSNPSVIFLDEPTSGLDARAASIVMRGLKRIADSGRAVCATIHQPSIAIFSQFDSLLLLKRGGETVFFGDLGENSAKLIEYLERYSVTPKIQPGENPASWMLTVMGAGSAQPNRIPFDYAGSYTQSKLHADCLEKIEAVQAQSTDANKISFPTKFATGKGAQAVNVIRHAMTVYFRSPNYNVVRVLVSAVVALLFSTVYIADRVPSDEGDMNSRINSIFIAVVFLCVNAINTVLSVFEALRNMFYRHKAAGMYDSTAILAALTIAEVPFLFVTSLVFSVLFYFIMGFAMEASKFFFFLLFLFLALTVFTYSGQMFVSLLPDSQTAQIICGLFISFTLLFSGVLIRPNQIPIFWIFAYWSFPGHYIFEGIISSQFDGDDTLIAASPNSPFFAFQNCTLAIDSECEGIADEWVQANFTDFSPSHIGYCAGFLLAFIAVTRIVTYLALTNLNYRRT